VASRAIGRILHLADARQRQPRIQNETASMSQDTRVATGPLPDLYNREKIGQRLMVLTLLAAVVVLDQAAKWWAWRHVTGAEINSGGDLLVGHTVGGWYKDPATGALLDLVDFGLLSIAVFILVRRRRPAAVVVSGALMLGGWGSNLLDRLGMHYWTAPGSVRGVVDFIYIGGAHYNVADFFIIGATPLFLMAVAYSSWRAMNRPVTVKAAVPATSNRPWLRVSMLALLGAGLVVVAVALGATNYGRVSTAPSHVSTKDDSHASSVVAII
jgi:lipoprotein signal peptidase